MLKVQERSQETRDQLLTSAARCFARSGYDATGVAEICQDAQVSKGAFYHHFPSKHAVFIALLEDWLKQLDSLLQSLTGTPQPVPEMLTHMGSMFSFIFQSASGRLPMFLEFWSKAIRDEEVWKKTIAPYHGYQQQIAQFMQKGMSEGALAEGDAQTAAWLIMALVSGIILQSQLDPQSANWEKVGRQGLQVMLEGLRKRDA
jgi:AcrR family transcriptional regulator